MGAQPTIPSGACQRHLFTIIVGAGLLWGLAGCTAPEAGGEVKGTAIAARNPRGPIVEYFDDFRGEASDRVYFDYDSSTIRQDYLPELQKAAAWIKRHPDSRIMIEGHADERGTREYNLALGARRAEALQTVLAGLEVPKSRLAGTISYGKERPAVVGSIEAAWARNRRAVMTVE